MGVYQEWERILDEMNITNERSHLFLIQELLKIMLDGTVNGQKIPKFIEAYNGLMIRVFLSEISNHFEYIISQKDWAPEKNSKTNLNVYIKAFVDRLVYRNYSGSEDEKKYLEGFRVLRNGEAHRTKFWSDYDINALKESKIPGLKFDEERRGPEVFPESLIFIAKKYAEHELLIEEL